VDGIKTGHTDSAGFCLVGSARRDDMRLISVVMGAESNSARTRASEALLKYGFQFFETRHLYESDAKVTDARVWYGSQETVKVGPGKGGASVTFPRGQYEKLKANLDLPARLEAPIKAGQVLGQAHIELNGKEITSIPLLALEDVPAGSMISQWIDRVRLMLQ
jgi:D-alanyl-D-alanine carboxypeptidase (penicillin-binding protein 5/6)